MTAKIKLNAASGGGSVSLQAPTSTTGNANVEFKLPVADGTSGQALTTNASGQLAFATVSTAIQTTSGTDNFTIADGNLVIGTAGHGIDFSAASNAGGMTGELLDDFEIGTFTPVYFMSGGGQSLTYSEQEGYYIKIGRLVNAHIFLEVNNVSANGSGAGAIGGLPFAMSGSNTGYAAASFGYMNGLGGSPTFVHGYMEQSQTAIYLYHGLSSGTSQNITIANNLHNGSQIRCSITYQTA